LRCLTRPQVDDVNRDVLWLRLHSRHAIGVPVWRAFGKRQSSNSFAKRTASAVQARCEVRPNDARTIRFSALSAQCSRHSSYRDLTP
jgi:hypothetical protein